MPTRADVANGDVSIAVFDLGGDGPPAILLHGLAGSSRELRPTAAALSERFRVLLVDQRGHGHSTRRPRDLSRDAFVSDVVAVIEQRLDGQQVRLVGQSMGAHTALLVAAARPDLVDRLVLLEGHVRGVEPTAAEDLGRFFASWPTPFPDRSAARRFLGDAPLATAWIEDLEATEVGLRPRFDPDIMQRTIAAVHVPRWSEWEHLTTPTLVVFAERGMFTDAERDELVRRRPATVRVDLPGAGHDAHLDAFDVWVGTLRSYLDTDADRGSG